MLQPFVPGLSILLQFIAAPFAFRLIRLHRSKVMKTLRVGNVADLVRLVLAAKPSEGFP
jgi:hypothetical protein